LIRILIATLGASLALAVAATAAEPPVKHFEQQATLGFFRGQQIEYLDFGPVKLAAGNKVAPLWTFTNGAKGQVNIVDTAPGRRNYSPLCSVNAVMWKDAGAARVLRSAAAVRRAQAAGDVTIKPAGVVVNCPVI
jgi:hypothetical protein